MKHEAFHKYSKQKIRGAQVRLWRLLKSGKELHPHSVFLWILWLLKRSLGMSNTPTLFDVGLGTPHNLLSVKIWRWSYYAKSFLPLPWHRWVSLSFWASYPISSSSLLNILKDYEIDCASLLFTFSISESFVKFMVKAHSNWTLNVVVRSQKLDNMHAFEMIIP